MHDILQMLEEKRAKARLGGLTPARPSWERADWNICGEFGLFGLCLPEDLGGLGLDAVSTARVAEAFGRGCTDLGLVFSALAPLFACAHHDTGIVTKSFAC